MHFKKIFITGAAMTLLVCSAMNVSAAETVSADYIKSLKESGKESLIIDVDAYKASYKDLAEAFGDNTDAYIAHYLNTGIYEGRTKGVLFDPLAYANAYSDVRESFGNDISAIVEHYVNFGVTENRTIGTANGFADISSAAQNGSYRIPVRRTNTGTPVSGSNTSAESYETNTLAADTNNAVSASVDSNDGSTENNYVSPSADSNNQSSPAPAPAADTGSNASSASDSTNYHHTTSIYTDDESTLLRVEYYDDNNHLFEYSSVSDYDKNTNSYTETVYQWDEENKVSVPTRTDTYVNGELTSSENH